MSNRCVECDERPAMWHAPTKNYLCAGHKDEYRRKWRAELERWAEEQKDIDRDHEFIVGLLVFGIIAFIVGTVLVVAEVI